MIIFLIVVLLDITFNVLNCNLM